MTLQPGTNTLSVRTIDLAANTTAGTGHDYSLLRMVSIATVDAVKPEGNSGSTAFTFTVTLDAAPFSTESVAWFVTGSGSSAANAADFVGGTLPSGSLTFALGETSKTITVLVAGDTAVEDDESFTVVLSGLSPGLMPGTTVATATIQNDDVAPVSITATDATKLEGPSGITPFTFTVTIGQAALSTQTVHWSVEGNGLNPATASDFVGGVLPSGVLTFAPGATSKVLTVNVQGSTEVEDVEGFKVTLSAPSSGLVLDNATANGLILPYNTVDSSGVILNGDAAATFVSIIAVDAIKAEGDSGIKDWTFLITRVGDTSVQQSVSWGVTGSGATPADPSDFGGILPTGVVTFGIGETFKLITVQVTGDTEIEPNEGFTVSLSAPSLGLTIATGAAGGTILNDDGTTSVHINASNDAYIILQDNSLVVLGQNGVLFNDDATVPVTAAMHGGPAHGTAQLTTDGGLSYTPNPGFTGIDSFSYSVSDGTGLDSEAHGLIYVVPVSTGATTTLNLFALTPEEQIATAYTAFFGRGADADGFRFWVHEFEIGLSQQGPGTLFANIASSFGVSNEAKAMYAFLANPNGASDSQIGVFLGSVYGNLFNRSADAQGLAYWTGEIRQTLAAGEFVGSILIKIVNGAQPGGDLETLMGKVAVGLEYVHQQEQHGMAWSGPSDAANAKALLAPVTHDLQTVLVGIKHAELLVVEHG